MRVVRAAEERRAAICEQVLRALPEWFGIESAIQNYIRDVGGMTTFVAEDEGFVVGFLSLRVHNEHTAEIHVMGVMPRAHRKGVGRAMIQAAQDFLRQGNFEFLSVKTLSPSRPNREYEVTRKFYLALGFRPVEEFKSLWGEANPCLLMIKSLKV